jgi:hypothetical protein
MLFTFFTDLHFESEYRHFQIVIIMEFHIFLVISENPRHQPERLRLKIIRKNALPGLRASMLPAAVTVASLAVPSALVVAASASVIISAAVIAVAETVAISRDLVRRSRWNRRMDRWHVGIGCIAA